MIQFQENAWTEGRKDGQTLFHSTLPATAGGPNTSQKEVPKKSSAKLIFINSSGNFKNIALLDN